jgi:hypothetical protein
MTPIATAKNNKVDILINVNIDVKADQLDSLPEKIKNLIKNLQTLE